MTRAERLDALIAKVAPKKAAFREKHGVWPVDEELEAGVSPGGVTSKDAVRRQPPYQILTLNGDRRRVLLTDDEGSTIAGIGANVEEALAGLEAKLA